MKDEASSKARREFMRSLLCELSPEPGPLRLGGLEARDLARRFGTPLFVYEAGILRRTHERARSAFGEGVGLLYALKANPNAAVASVLRTCGAGAEVASAGEIRVALLSGFEGGQIHFAGPAKSEADLRLALETGVFSLNLESEGEYEAVKRLAVETGLEPGVSVRVNPGKPLESSRLRMGGGSHKFGVDEGRVPGLLKRIAGDGACRLRGLHLYLGTQCFEAGAWVDSARFLLAFAESCEKELGMPLSCLNFGGGFGVPVCGDDPVFDLEGAGQGLQSSIAEFGGGSAGPFLVEPGRYLVARAGVYLTRVLYTKESQGRSFALLDGGMHHHAAGAGVGSVLRRPHPVVACKDPRPEQTFPVTLGGPLCTPSDEFGGGLPLPRLEEGDLCAILVSGAYGLSFSPVWFLGHPSPAEVLVDRGEAFLVRERGDPGDAVRGQRLP